MQIKNEWHGQGWLDKVLITQKILTEFRLAYKIKDTSEKKFNLHWEVQR